MWQYDFLATDFNESKVMHATHAHQYLHKLTHDLNENLLKLGKLGVLT